jgi:hypothetical protein
LNRTLVIGFFRANGYVEYEKDLWNYHHDYNTAYLVTWTLQRHCLQLKITFRGTRTWLLYETQSVCGIAYCYLDRSAAGRLLRHFWGAVRGVRPCFHCALKTYRLANSAATQICECRTWPWPRVVTFCHYFLRCFRKHSAVVARRGDVCLSHTCTNSTFFLSCFFSLLSRSLEKVSLPTWSTGTLCFPAVFSFWTTLSSFTKHAIRYHKNSLIPFSYKQSWQYGGYANLWDGNNNDANE